jgi:hypothetical protein
MPIPYSTVHVYFSNTGYGGSFGVIRRSHRKPVGAVSVSYVGHITAYFLNTGYGRSLVSCVGHVASLFPIYRLRRQPSRGQKTRDSLW